MSWLAKSLANTFNSDDDDKKKIEEEEEEEEEEKEEEDDPSSETAGGKGVKEDLSELTKSFTRQLWGVASFLAPPPTTPTTHDYPSSSSPSARLTPDSDSPSSLKRSEYEDSHLIARDSPRMAGIRNDLSEIGGRFKSGISMLASGNTVSEISKFASSFLPFGSGDDEEDSEEMGDEAVGITEEVLTFARNISKHPETWLDFPLLADDQYADDFEMSDAQQDHALAVERLSPRLAALRIELCPRHMSEGCFWKIYFVLLHSRLSKHDAELLSTPQIVQARSTLQELQSRTRTGSAGSESSTFPHEQHAPKSETESSFKYASSEPAKILNVDYNNKQLSMRNELRVDDKAVVDEESVILNKDILPQTLHASSEKFEDEGDEWLEETTEISGPEHVTSALVNEENVSFSDLEDDGDGDYLPEISKAKDASDSSADGSKGWIQLSDTPSDDAGEDGGSTASSHPSDFLSSKDKSDQHRTRDNKDNDWLSVDDIDVV